MLNNSKQSSLLLSQRAQEVLRQIVTSYMETGDPVSSRFVARNSQLNLSPASIRNIMADLEDMDILVSPHASAGRVPTVSGLQLFVQGLLQIGELSKKERHSIANNIQKSNNLEQLLDSAASQLSGLTQFAGLVITPKRDSTIKQFDFVPIAENKALLILVTEEGEIENRLIDLPDGVSSSELTEAANFITRKFCGKNLENTRQEVKKELQNHKKELSRLTSKVIESGLAHWSSGKKEEQAKDGFLIVRGQHLLLNNIDAMADLDRIRTIFSAIDKRRSILRLLDATDEAKGVQVFIGADNSLFSLTGCSAVFAPIKSSNGKNMLGALGVIGPSRMNYSRIVPLVDFTAEVVSKITEKTT